MPLQATPMDDFPMSSKLLISKTINLIEGNPEEKRREILAYFHETFTLYEGIFECLSGDSAYFQKANSLRHPLIFYYGHTAVFFTNKLIIAGLIDARVDKRLESVLAIGVDEMSWDDLDETHYKWPSVQAVKDYRNKVRAMVDGFIKTCDLSLPIAWNDPLWIILMGIEHERIHLETTSILIRELPLERVNNHAIWGQICTSTGVAPENELLPVAGGLVSLGTPHDDSTPRAYYGWDNEYGQVDVLVSGFKASKYLVSNQEFLKFVEDEGYQTRSHWTKEGWKWVQFRQAEYPVFWTKKAAAFQLRTMLEIIDMPWDWPAEVNFLEAEAFCRWKSKTTGRSIRLPSEAEWHKLRGCVEEDQPDWAQAPGNINLEYEMSSCPVTRHEFEGGFFDVIGNVWQWTVTATYPYPGFKVHPVYDDFAVPTFDGQHNLFKGGCWISTGNYALRESRYAFRRHFFQHAGFRYVEAGLPPEPEATLARSGGVEAGRSTVFERDEKIAQSIEFHFGETYFDVPNFPVVCAQICKKWMANEDKFRALEIGCGTGRGAFELATFFDHVDALDFSTRTIQVPAHLQRNGIQGYRLTEEGAQGIERTISLDGLGYDDTKNRIVFAQADVCNLDVKYHSYNLVFGGNLLTQLYDPAAFLLGIKNRIVSGGLLVLASTYAWQASVTPREKWIGHPLEGGKAASTLEGLKKLLAPEFELMTEPQDIPFVRRETERTYLHNSAQLTVWRRLP